MGSRHRAGSSCATVNRQQDLCGCATSYGAAPNTQVCEVCLGMPGSLPVLNKKALEYALKMALATDCRIAPQSVLRPQELFLPRSAQGLPDLPIRAAPGASRVPRHPGRRPGQAHRHHPDSPGGRRRQAGPQRDPAGELRGLQPHRGAPDRDRLRAGPQEPRGGGGVSQGPAQHPALSGGSATATWRRAPSAATPTSRCGRWAPRNWGSRWNSRT